MSIRSASTPFVHAEGSGSPVLLLHGLGASSHIFGALMLAQRRRFHFYALDLPGTGKSGRYAKLEPAAVADFLDGWCKSQHLGKVLVVGHSFGGVVALELAARHPRRVAGLVLASVPALGLQGSRSFLKRDSTSLLARLAGKLPPSRFLAKAYLRSLWYEPRRITAAQVDGYVRAMGEKNFFTNMLEAARALDAYRLPSKVLSTFKGPIRLLWGEKDTLVPLIQGEHLARTLNADFTILPRTGHCVPEERPDALAVALVAVARAARVR